jgi:hypothetical protein
MKFVLCVTLMFCAGCSTIKRVFTRQAAISVVGTSPLTGKEAPIKVTNPDNAGEPATLHSNEAVTEAVIERGARVTLPMVVNGTETTATIELPPIKLSKRELATSASASAPDKAIALREIEVEASRPLLFAALGCVAAAIFFVWRAFPTPAMLAGAGAVIFFLAWKVSTLPSWFFGLGLVAASAGVAIFWGYQRRERDAQDETQ